MTVALHESCHHNSRWLHWLAWLTLVSSLLPVGLGAMTTTVDAGMAFADWPTSDGQGMLEYPWLKSTGDKFLEHGHRLAGMLVGMIATVLLVVAFRVPVGSTRRWLSIAVFAGVVLQGLLGGARVRLETAGIADGKTLAMIHGNFAVLATSLMALLVLMTGRWWQQTPKLPIGSGRGVVIAAWTLGGALLAQYVLGSQLRHLADSHAWLVHPWFAIVVVISAIWLCLASWRLGRGDLFRSTLLVLALLVAQAALGVVTWALLYGYPQFDLVAVQHSSVQSASRSLHKVLAWIATIATVMAIVRVVHVAPRRIAVSAASTASIPVATATPLAGAAS